MSKPHLSIVPREPDDDDFMEAVVEVGAMIQLQAPQPQLTAEQKEPPPPRSNVLSFTAYVRRRTADEDSLPVFVPFDEFGKPVWTR
jgi:hypothetical protein